MKYINEFIKHKEYKGEKAIYRVNDNCGNTYYSDEYVNWLEEQLRIHDVSGSLPISCINDFEKPEYCSQRNSHLCQKCKDW